MKLSSQSWEELQLSNNNVDGLELPTVLTLPSPWHRLAVEIYLQGGLVLSLTSGLPLALTAL